MPMCSAGGPMPICCKQIELQTTAKIPLTIAAIVCGFSRLVESGAVTTPSELQHWTCRPRLSIGSERAGFAMPAFALGPPEGVMG
jgi:hypothetical protein